MKVIVAILLCAAITLLGPLATRKYKEDLAWHLTLMRIEPQVWAAAEAISKLGFSMEDACKGMRAFSQIWESPRK